MTIALVTRAFIPFALLALLSACERPHGPPPPKATAGAAASATSSAAGPAAPGTVALSGTILEPQPNPATVKPAARAKAATAAVAPASAGTASADRQALRDFQAEQERRDRELLDQDLSEAQTRSRDEARDSEAYQLPREDGDWSASDQPPPEDELPFDEPPYDEPPYDEPPYDEPPYDEPPYDDEPELDDGYDPRDGAYRP